MTGLFVAIEVLLTFYTGWPPLVSAFWVAGIIGVSCHVWPPLFLILLHFIMTYVDLSSFLSFMFKIVHIHLSLSLSYLSPLCFFNVYSFLTFFLLQLILAVACYIYFCNLCVFNFLLLKFSILLYSGTVPQIDNLTI
jgi:hypothetical protein